MLRDEWKRLKSGTDIRGVAMDGVEGQPVQLTDETVKMCIRDSVYPDQRGHPL